MTVACTARRQQKEKKARELNYNQNALGIDVQGVDYSRIDMAIQVSNASCITVYSFS